MHQTHDGRHTSRPSTDDDQVMKPTMVDSTQLGQSIGNTFVLLVPDHLKSADCLEHEVFPRSLSNLSNRASHHCFS